MSIKKNSVFNLIGGLIPIALSIVIIPIYLKLIGEARYGVLTIAWLILGYFGLFDLGLGRATAQQIASENYEEKKIKAKIFWTSLSMNLCIGLLGGILLWPFAYIFFNDFFLLENNLKIELITSLPWLIIAVPLSTVTSVFFGALHGVSKFLELNIISVLSSALIQLLPLLVALSFGPDLRYIIPAVIFARFLVSILLYLRCWTHLLKEQKIEISRDKAKQMLKFGSWLTITSFLSPMMVMLDRFIIGTILGAKFVTYYTVPFQLAEKTSIISGALASSLFPRIASNKKNNEEINRITSLAMNSLNSIITPLTLVGILLVEYFFEWWLGSDFASSASLTAEFLLIGFWANNLAIAPFIKLQATGNPDTVAKCHLYELLPYFIILYFTLKYWGLPGAAVAFGLRTFADYLLLLKYSGDLKGGLKNILFPVIFLVLAILIAYYFPIYDMMRHTLSLLSFLMCLIWAWGSLDNKLKEILKFFYKRILLMKS